MLPVDTAARASSTDRDGGARLVAVAVDAPGGGSRTYTYAVPVPLSDLDHVIQECRDAKTLAGLLWFKAYVA